MDGNPFAAPEPAERPQPSTPPAATAPEPATKSHELGAPALYIGGCILLLGAVWLALSFRSVNIMDNDLPLLSPTYEKRDHKIVKGEILGGIVGASNKTVQLCPMTKGVIVRQASKYHLSCPKENTKSFTTNTDGTFTGELTPGSYLINVELSGTEKSSDVPARINVHTGERATFTISITDSGNDQSN